MNPEPRGPAGVRSGQVTWTHSLLFCALALALAARGSISAELEQSDLFVAGADGYHTYRIPAVVVSTRGTLLAFCEGRKNSGGDAGKIDLLLKRSTDGGKTWSAQQIIWSDGNNTCGNPAPVVDRDTGVVWLLMTWNLGTDREREIERGSSRDTRRVFVAHSDDDGVTWARPLEITDSVKKPDWRWYATGPVNGIQLTRGPHRGRLIVPANHSEISTNGQPVSRSQIIYSDDHGKTWKLGGVEDEATNESTVVELADGSLLQNMRSGRGKNRRAVATSRDAGSTWSPARLDPELIEPVCQASLLRYSWPEDGKSRILFANPASVKRERMTVRLSYDEGATWPASRIIHAGPSAYSCLAVLPDKTIGCLFECGEKTSYERIVFGRFPLDWLEKNTDER